MIEAVRQLRGEAHPNVQVQNCDLALAHGTGGSLGTRHGSVTVIMNGVNQMTVKQRTFPSPIADPDTEQFWTAAKNGKLMVGSCNSCGENITILEVSVLLWSPRYYACRGLWQRRDLLWSVLRRADPLRHRLRYLRRRTYNDDEYMSVIWTL